MKISLVTTKSVNLDPWIPQFRKEMQKLDLKRGENF